MSHDTSYAAPIKPMSAGEERTLGAAMHWVPLIATVLSAGTLGFLGSLVMYLVFKDRGEFVRAQGANSLNVQIATGIGLLVSLVLMLVLIGFVTWWVVLAWAVVLHALGAVKAHRGEWWTPPLTPRFVR